jgi:membrane protein DedA with SNARE-associated domain
MALENVLPPLPSEVVMPLAGWMLVKANGLGAGGVFLLAFWGTVGSTLGSMLVYSIGRWGGRPFVDRFGRYVLVSKEDVASGERWFAKYGNWAVLLLRMVPLVRSVVSFPAGIARMPIGLFVLLTFLGSYPWSLGLAYAGYLLGEHWEEVRAVIRPFDYVILALLALLVVWYVYAHVRRFRTSVERRSSDRVSSA